MPEDRCERRAQVTPEMVDAGMNVLVDYDRGWDDPEEFLRRVFAVMYEAMLPISR